MEKYFTCLIRCKYCGKDLNCVQNVSETRKQYIEQNSIEHCECRLYNPGQSVDPNGELYFEWKEQNCIF